MRNKYNKLLPPAVSVFAAILMTGGGGSPQSVEVFLPATNTSCLLPSLPDRRRGHTQVWW